MTFKQFKFYIQANWIKTLYFNFKLLPFKQAIKCPILLFGKCDVNIGKDAMLTQDEPQPFASTFIGNSCSAVWGFNKRAIETYIDLRGHLHIIGNKQFIGNGCRLIVEDTGTLTLGNHIVINDRTKICCQHEIIIGDYTGISWECQFFDTNFHYMTDTSLRVGRKNGTIRIGRNCWIGNRCTIQKNTILEEDSILASNSLINKDFSGIKQGTFAGTPAKHICSGKLRIRNVAMENAIERCFREHPDIDFVSVNIAESKKYNSSENLGVEPILNK